MDLSLVIPTWNGRHLLERYLPAVLGELERWQRTQGAVGELVVSDDGSTDDTGTWLQSHYPQVRLVHSPQNGGFSAAVNRGVAVADGAVIVLLNNDLYLFSHALDPILPWFVDPDCFGCTFRALDRVGAFSTGGKQAEWARGFWHVWKNYEAGGTVDVAVSENPSATTSRLRLPSAKLVGGFCAFRRAMFQELGGFDLLFSPYYWEDTDLSFRARKRGWTIGYEPCAQVRHEVSATVVLHAGRFRRQRVIERNRLLFHWLNLDGGNLARNLAWTHLLLLQMLLKGNFAYHAGYLSAMSCWPAILRRRHADRRHWRLPDVALALGVPPGGKSTA